MRITVILSIIIAATVFNSPEKQGVLKEGHIKIDNRTREYVLYMPDGLDDNSPLLVAFHGYTGNDTSFMKYSGLNRVAEKYKFAVCYPQGLSDSSGKTFWQVGYSFHRNQKVDDVRFISELTKYLQSKYGFDPGRTYATGVSNGGDMCILLACKRPDVFRAVAPVIGCMMKINLDSCRSAIPVPVFMINSTKDPITWWEGDMADKGGWGPYLPVLATFDFFMKKNNCTTTVVDTLPDISKSDSSFIIATRSKGKTGRDQVWLYTVVNGHHDWPGGSGNMDIDAAEEIWKFFRTIEKNP